MRLSLEELLEAVAIVDKECSLTNIDVYTRRSILDKLIKSTDIVTIHKNTEDQVFLDSLLEGEGEGSVPATDYDVLGGK